jgi:hypothetical protein
MYGNLKGGVPMSSVKYLLAAALSGSLLASLSGAAIPAGYAGRPFPAGSAPREIPGRINFHEYDLGGPNVTFVQDDPAYGPVSGGGTAGGRDKDGDHSWPAFFLTGHPSDTFYAAGVNYPKGVPYPSADTSLAANHWYIGACHPNNWTKFTIHVPKAGKYWISTIFAVMGTSMQCHVSFMNGAKTVITKTTNLPAKNSYHAWQLYKDFASVQLDSGVQVMQFYNECYHINQDFLYIAADSGKFSTGIRHTEAPSNNPDDYFFSGNEKNAGAYLTDAETIKISAFDCLGRKLLEGCNRSLAATRHEVNVDMANVKAGIYFVRIEYGNSSSIVKFGPWSGR